MRPPYRQAAGLADCALATHGFFGRDGGVSAGLYASLNVGLGSDDDPAAVLENRTRCAAMLGAAPDRLLTLYQIHSADVVLVQAPWTEPPRADAMVTDQPGLALGVLAADCTPVLLADPDAGVIGAAHAGWKGALAGVAEATVAAMTQLGAAPPRIRAAIGPCIRQPSYEVGADFAERFAGVSPDNARFFAPGARPDKRQFDLPGFVAARLTQAGVAAVEDLGLCTYENPARYFSYRRATHRGDPDYGRNLSAIMLRP